MLYLHLQKSKVLFFLFLIAPNRLLRIYALQKASVINLVLYKTITLKFRLDWLHVDMTCY